MITKEGLFKYQALNERQRKNLAILETIRKNGPISKASLSRQLGYNIVTLSNHVDEYMKKGLIFERGLDASSGGRRPALIEVNKNEQFLIGVDLNKETLTAILTNAALDILGERQTQRPPIEQEELKNALVALLKELIKNSTVDPSKIKFIAVGTYGTIWEKSGAIKGLDEDKGRSRATIYFTDLKQALEKEFATPTFFGADASLAAFGEKAKNPSADVDNMLYIFGDMGKGVVMKGGIFCSTDLGGVDLEGITGDLTNEEKTKLREEALYLKPWNFQMSLKNEAMKVIESGVGTKIVEILKGNLEGINDEVVMRAAKDKDEIAVELIEGIGINLGVRIAYLINLFAPQVVIIGGGVQKAGELLFNQIEKTVEKLSLEKPRESVKIIPSGLNGRAVTLGAAAVGLRELFLEA